MKSSRNGMAQVLEPTIVSRNIIVDLDETTELRWEAMPPKRSSILMLSIFAALTVLFYAALLVGLALLSLGSLVGLASLLLSFSTAP